MPVPFIMPKFDMDQEQATIISWEKRDGDFVKFEETVLTVETDKVAIEVPSPATGTLARITYKDGDVVPVTTVIAYILKDGETLADLPKADITPPLSKPEVDSVSQSLTSAQATPVALRMAKEEGVDLSKVASSGDKITRRDVELYLANQTPASRVAVAATPAARRVAREKGIDLENVAGSGPRGRVQSADVSQTAKQIPASVS